jgi:hypothetical protein
MYGCCLSDRSCSTCQAPHVTHVTHVTSGTATRARERAGRQEASARGGRHLLLGDRMLDALGATLQQVVLAEHLHCDNLLRAGVPRHHHAPELALAQDTAEGKVLDAGLPGVVRHISAEPLFFWPFDPRPRTPKVKLFVLARGKSRCAIPTVRCEITEQISAHQSMHLPDDAFFGDERNRQKHDLPRGLTTEMRWSSCQGLLLQ